MTCPAGLVLSTGTGRFFSNPLCVRSCWHGSWVRPAQSGTCLVPGPELTRTLISLVIADVWFGDGMVVITRSFGTVGLLESVRLKRSKPASLSLLTHSA